MNFDEYEFLTFDCYGTLIDWESGILGALKPLLSAHGKTLDDDRILSLYAEIESEAESGEYIRYREVLRRVVREFGARLGFVPSTSELDSLAESIAGWTPFSDTVDALRDLKKKYRLAIISNIDDDLIELTSRHLEVGFDHVITAEQVGSYKPSHANFNRAIEVLGVPPGRILHVAQSLFHDVVPAKELGFPTVWVNRRKDRSGAGATPPANAVPDLEVTDLGELARLTVLR